MSSRSLSPATACARMQALALCFLALVSVAAPARAQSSLDPVYVFHTTLGDIKVQLFPDVTPKTVANFLTYVNSGVYTDSIFHRSVPGFVVQGGAYQVTSGPNGPIYTTIPTNPPVVNEFHLSNVRGTIAMAKVDKQPNSATDEWFFNESDSNAANLDNQNGGFTVFGRVTDSASLAVMDKIAAVPVPNPQGFQDVPLIDYQASKGVQISNLILVTSIMPAWAAVSVSVGVGGSAHLLWDRGDGGAAVWSLDAQGNQTGSSAIFGPYDGWTARQVAVAPDGNSRLLWTHADGRVTVWNIGANLAHVGTAPVFGPYPGWSGQSLSVGPDGSTRLLWNNADGRAVLWTLNASGSQTGVSPYYGPYTGWTVSRVSVGPDGSTRLLWNNSDGHVEFWSVNAAGGKVFYSPLYGPYTGWSATDLSVGPDNVTHVLWNNTNGQMVEWMVNASGAATAYSPLYGPYAGWVARAIAVGPDNNAHVLWDNADLRGVVWMLNSAGSHTTDSPIFGPY